jgi:hypothetical protein
MLLFHHHHKYQTAYQIPLLPQFQVIKESQLQLLSQLLQSKSQQLIHHHTSLLFQAQLFQDSHQAKSTPQDQLHHQFTKLLLAHGQQSQQVSHQHTLLPFHHHTKLLHQASSQSESFSPQLAIHHQLSSLSQTQQLPLNIHHQSSSPLEQPHQQLFTKLLLAHSHKSHIALNHQLS